MTDAARSGIREPQGFDIVSDLTMDAIRAEVLRAHLRWKDSPTGSMMSPDQTVGEKLAILTEEVGEVATACLPAFSPAGGPVDDDLEGELIQVAAMAVSWLEAIYASKVSA